MAGDERVKKTLLVNVMFDSTARIMPVAVGYRPHFVIPESEYLMGVEFVNILNKFAFDVSLNAEVNLLYNGVDYSSLSVGTNFDIREGTHIVGCGRVIK